MARQADGAKQMLRIGGGVSSGTRIPFLSTRRLRDRFIAIFENRFEYGTLTVLFPGGGSHRFEGTKEGPDAIIDIKSWNAVKRLVFGGTLGFSQAYIEKEWESPDVVAVLEFGARNNRSLDASLRGWPLIAIWNRLRHRLHPNTRSGARRNIHYHYDLGNEFYSAWLDSTMTYSSAIFDAGDNSLEAAQRRKYRRLLDILDAKPGDHILEIGSGWGGFAEVAAGERGAKVTSITISEEQLRFARARIQKAGLGDLARFEFVDYRDIEGRFDHVVSIEMFEAVGHDYWPDYFRKIEEVLKPGGRAALQIITIDDELFESYRRNADFIQTYVFPGGMLGAIDPLKRIVSEAGLAWRGFRRYGHHYAETLARWRRRFDVAVSEGRLPAEFDDMFQRIWRYYLSYCEGGFRGGSIDVIQLELQKSRG